MKIGIEAQRLFRKKKHGMEVVTLELIRHLQEIDKENEYVVFVKDDEDVGCVQSTANFVIYKTPVFSYPFWEQLYLPKIAKRAEIDLLHCTSNTAPVFYHSPMMLTLHDIIYLEKVSFAGTSYQDFGNLYRRFVVPKVVGHCESIVTVSEFEKKCIVEKLGLPETKVKVVYNAISKNFRKINDKNILREVIKKYHLPEQFILFFGNTAPKKNAAGVLEAYGKYFTTQPDPLLLVVTDCTRAYVEKIFKKINLKQKGNILKNILVLDHIPLDELPCVYNLATLFLYPSLRESFGMPIIEAMACGTPVITSNTSSMPEVAGEAALLVHPGQPDAIAEGIQEVLNNPVRRRQMIHEGLARAARFSWKKTAQQMLQIYQQSVAS